MNWFKFYGQDWLTDLKVMRLSPQDRLVYLTLLCLASSAEDRGTIKDCEELYLIELTHLPGDPSKEGNDFNKAVGCLKRFEALGMITMITNDNKTDVIINAFAKRQETNLTAYERVKRYREKHKTLIYKGDSDNENDNVPDVIIDNARVDKNRVDKNRGEGDVERYPLSYLKAIPKEDIKALTDTYDCSEDQVIKVAETIVLYCQSKGKKYKNYKATLTQWILRDFPKKQTVNYAKIT